MTAAEDVVWQAADALGDVPIGNVISAYPLPARNWLTGWLASPAQWCGHFGDLMVRPFGSRRLACWPCAEEADLMAYIARCGRCGAIAGPDGFGGFFALGRVLVLVSMCAACAHEGGFGDE